MKSALVSLMVWLGSVAVALAQGTDGPNGYVTGGFTLASQPDEDFEGDRYLASSTLGGWSAGLHVGLGGHLSDGFSASVELSVPGAVSGQRELWTHAQIVATYEVQETMVTALGRGHIGRDRVQFQPMGGFTWVRTRTSLVEGSFRTITGTVTPLNPREQTDVGTALTFGADMSVTVAPRVALSPFFRAHLVNRPDPAETEDWLRLPGFVYRLGVVVIGRW